jgi:hypothetical protein
VDIKTAPLLGRFLHLGHFCTGLFSPYRIPSSIRDFLAAFAPAAVRVREEIVEGIASQPLELENSHDPAVGGWDATGSTLG